MARKIVILNSRPGMLRGGRAHPRKAVHDVAEFTAEQLAEIEAEPNFATHQFDEIPPTEIPPSENGPEAADEPAASGGGHRGAPSRRKAG